MHKGYCRIHIRTVTGFDFYERGEVEYHNKTYFIHGASYPEEIVISCVQLVKAINHADQEVEGNG